MGREQPRWARGHFFIHIATGKKAKLAADDDITL